MRLGLSGRIGVAGLDVVNRNQVGNCEGSGCAGVIGACISVPRSASVGRSPADACSLTFAPPRAAVQDEAPEGYRQLDEDGAMPVYCRSVSWAFTLITGAGRRDRPRAGRLRSWCWTVRASRAFTGSLWRR